MDTLPKLTLKEARRILTTSEDTAWLKEKDRLIDEAILEYEKQKCGMAHDLEKFGKSVDEAKRRMYPHERKIMEAHAEGQREAAAISLEFMSRIEKDILELAGIRQKKKVT